MKLLILTQAADLEEPVLGFFHAWISALSKRAEQVSVICLQEGKHAFPQNVRVYSLGKEHGRSRIKYLWRLFRFVWSLREEYDSVFVHMNPEYIVLVGSLWRLWGKRVVLWRNHRRPDVYTRLAIPLSDVVCYTSSLAYVSRFSKAVQMPIGIDTDLFKRGSAPADTNSILFLGRLDAVKHPDVFLEALALLVKDNAQFRADIYGDPTPGREAYASELRERYAGIKGVSFYPAVTNDQTPAIYSTHAIYVNLTPSGSFDKTIGEAMSSGCVVVAANDALRGVLPDALIVDPQSPESVVAGVRAALVMDAASRAKLSERSRAYIEREHSLSLLASKLAALYKT